MWIGLSDSFFAYPLILLLHTIGLTLIVGVNLVVALRVLGVVLWAYTFVQSQKACMLERHRLRVGLTGAVLADVSR